MQIGSGRSLALIAATFLLAGTAQAVQFTPAPTDRLNTFLSGDPGSPFITGPGGVDYDGVGTADPHPGEAVVDGEISSLFINGSTEITFTDSIDFTLEAQLASVAINPLGGTTVQLVATFTGTSDGVADLIITDSEDGSVLLESNLVGGTLNGNPVAPLTAVATFDTTSIPAQPNAQAFAFFQTDVQGNPWEILFSDDIGSLNDEGVAQTLISNFMPDFTTIANAVISSGDLPSFDAEANGFIFAVDGSNFQVPEPSSWALVLAGLGGLAWIRRRE